MEKLQLEMHLCDNMASDEEVALVHEFGFGLAFPALREHGTVDKARAFLEARRAGLQISRWENKTGG